MATLRLSRPHGRGGNARPLSVKVDAQGVAALTQGESISVQVLGGTHEATRADGRGKQPTLEVEVVEDDEVHVDVALRFSAIWNMLARPGSALGHPAPLATERGGRSLRDSHRSGRQITEP